MGLCSAAEGCADLVGQIEHMVQQQQRALFNDLLGWQAVAPRNPDLDCLVGQRVRQPVGKESKAQRGARRSTASGASVGCSRPDW